MLVSSEEKETLQYTKLYMLHNTRDTQNTKEESGGKENNDL